VAQPAAPVQSLMTPGGTIAYFSMEVALQSELPTYAGGLGALAGDTLRSAADLALPMVGMTLLHRTGYFFQRLDDEGRQHEEPVAWSPDDWLVLLDATCTVEVEGRPVRLRAWRYTLEGAAGSKVPVFLLDSDVPGNDAADRRLTDQLYGGDDRYRLAQEVLLGIGGVRILRALGYRDVSRFHMNEGHAALLALELFAEELGRTPDRRDEAIERVKRRCVFTTHTPVPAGHDQFARTLAERVIGPDHVKALEALGCCDEALNLTHVALQLSHYVNGVTRRHGEISRSLFPGYPIGSITNGVHSVTWTSPPFTRLFDRHMPDWRRNSASLRYAVGIPLEAIAEAHKEAKRDLLAEVNARSNAGFDQDVFTLGFARRATPYKRPALLFHDPQRLRRLAGHAGLQIVLAGKAHPRDDEGKDLIRRVISSAAGLGPEVKVAYLDNYDIRLAKRLIAGVDVWVNTPKPPWEASGTSGMKAAHNGVPSVSVLDGWWWEGHLEGVTGWAIGSRDRETAREWSDAADADDLYRALEQHILPLFYDDRDHWSAVMRSTIALNASFFNAQRMLQEYVAQAYCDPG
jgi:glycogen phosphorylase